MLDDVRGYFQLASGLTEVTANKAKEMAMSLVGQGFTLSTKAPDVVGQVQELADDLVSTSKNNREMLVAMIRSEVDKAVGRMGFVREDELAALRRHVQRLEQQLEDFRAQPRSGDTNVASVPTATKKPEARAKPTADSAAGSPSQPRARSGVAPVVAKKKKVAKPDRPAPDAG